MDKISVAHFTLTIVSFESVRGLDFSEMNGGIELFHRYVVSYLAVFFLNEFDESPKLSETRTCYCQCRRGWSGQQVLPIENSEELRPLVNLSSLKNEFMSRV